MKCDCNMCNLDFSSDNGYEYVLEELKTTRKHIDNVIKIIEKRMEKDAIIEEVLNSCQDDCDMVDDKTEEDRTILDDIIEATSRRSAINNWNTTVPAYWSIYPPNILRRFPYRYY